MSRRIIISLCDHSGVWSEPYLRAGYDVRRYDIQRDGTDIRFDVEHPGRVHGILAAPPCTIFSRAGQWVRRTREDRIEGHSVVDACLRFVATCSPVWWALENPAGTLKRYLGEPTFRFHPYMFGDPWPKLTCLWGRFSIPRLGPVVEPCLTMASPVMRSGGRQGAKGKAARSKTPAGFAAAFFAANQ